MDHTRNVTPMKARGPLTPAITDVQEQIRIRAYQLFEQRGRKDGHDLDDWLKAEAEVIRQARTAVA